MIAGGNHGIRIGTPMILQDCSTAGIQICDDVWIGANASVLDGVTIEEGCIIAAGSVVTKSTVKNGVYYGVPATLMKIRTNDRK
jgi:acetyltransferase-like isoleucine patch superfamily enzyme